MQSSYSVYENMEQSNIYFCSTKNKLCHKFFFYLMQCNKFSNTFKILFRNLNAIFDLKGNVHPS